MPKDFIVPAYTFVPGVSGSGTVDLTGISAFNIKRLVAIINQKTGVVIYATGKTALRYTAVAGTLVTLFADTSAMNAGDGLQVIYQDPTAVPVADSALAAAVASLILANHNDLAAILAKQPSFGTAGTASANVLTVQGIASMTPLKTDGSGVTQPVSGTVGIDSSLDGTTNLVNIGSVALSDIGNIASATGTISGYSATSDSHLANIEANSGTIITNLGSPLQEGGTVDISKIAGTSVSVGSGGTDAGTQRVTIVNDNPTITVSIANSYVSSDLEQVNGSAVSTGNGPVASGTQRVAIANDNDPIPVALTAGLSEIGHLEANQTVDLNKVAGTAVAIGNGAVDAGTQRVAIANDNDPVVVTADLSKVGGIATSVGAGAVDAGTQRVTLVNDVLVPTSAIMLVGGTNMSTGDGTVDVGTPRVVLASDIALPSGTNVLGALTANQSVNVSQINGVTPLMGAGNTGTGSARVTIASDQVTIPVSIATAPALIASSAIIGNVRIDQTTPGTTNLVALAANQSVNLAQANGVTLLMGAGNTGTGSPRVTIASDQATIPVSIATAPVLIAGAAIIGKVGIDQTTPGTTNAVAIIAGQNGVAGGSGVTGATVQRMVLATDVGLPAGESHTGAVGGATPQVTATFTRPSDTNAYAALDTVSDSTTIPTLISFSNAARVSGGTGYVTGAILITSQAACVARFRLYLYSNTLTATNDNAAFTILITNKALYLGYIDFPACQTEGAGSDFAVSQAVQLRLPYTCNATTLSGRLETLDAFTPATGQTFDIRLATEQN